jgi:hypothetical protein
VLHTTWLVNSATHLWGYRTYLTRDRSTNLWWVALLTYGEGWHNNHHAFQTSARHGLRWWEVDLTYGFIRLLTWAQLAHAVKLPDAARVSSIAAAAPGSERGGRRPITEYELSPAGACTATAFTASQTLERGHQWA